MKLDEKTALITGGGSGIGAACAWHMAREGAAVAVTGVPADGVSQVATELQSAGHQAVALPTDVRHEEQIAAAVAATVKAFGRLDIVVASAAIQLHDRDHTLHELDAEVWDETHAVNFRGVFLTCKHGLRQLVSDWPVAVESITLVGFSMGGLVTRSAMHVAAQRGMDWLGKVDRAAYVCTPHHGAALERGGFLLQKSITFSPYTAPLAALGRIRSDGITDLRHGNILDEDWRGHDAHADNGDHRRPAPLAAGIEHYAIAATLSQQQGESIGHVVGDGLVHPKSATGRHADPDLDLAFENSRVRTFYGQSHLGMLGYPRVSACLQGWLEG